MEKEFKERFAEAENLISLGQKEDAIDVLSEINWKKVHNQNAFMKAADLYESMGENDLAKELLSMSHERSPMGRKALKQLALLCTKMNDTEEALSYYEEFSEIAPNDPDKYIILYEIEKKRGAALPDLIAILETYKDAVFDDGWALQLAYLYHDAGDAEKCLELCDEIYTYFGEGVYVEKALELKMSMRPLSMDQEESYRSFQYKKDGLTEIKANEVLESGEIINHTIAIPSIELSPDRFNTVNLQAEIKKNIEEIMKATEAASVSENMEAIKDLVNDLPYLDRAEEDSVEKHKKAKDKLDDTIRTQYQSFLEEEYDGQMSLFVPDRQETEAQIEGQLTITEVMEDWEKTRRAAEAALAAAKAEELRNAKEEALREATDIMNRLSDIAPQLEADYKETEVIRQEAITVPEETHISALEMYKRETPGEEAEEETDADIPEEKIHDGETAVSNIMNLDDSFFEPDVAGEEEAAEEESDVAEENEVAEEIEEKPEEAVEDEPVELQEESEVVEEGIPEEVAAEDAAEEIVEEESIEEPAEEQEEIQEEVSEEEEPPKKLSQETKIFKVPKADQSGNITGIGLEIPVIKLDEDGNITEEKPLEVSDEKPLLSGKLTQNTREWKPPRLTDGEEMILGQTVAEMLEDEEKKKEPVVEPSEEESAEPEKSISELKKESDEEEAAKEAEELEKIEEELKERKFILSEEEKGLFVYFLPIEGMEKQIVKAVNNIGRRIVTGAVASEGNLIIQGGRGSGKSEMAKSIVQVLRTEYQKPGQNMGTIKAANLNEKDVQAIYQKIRGGCLIIENAGDLERDTAVTLKLLMDNDNDGTLIILEDTRVGIERLKRTEITFVRMFTDKINIPIFSSDELVLFGKKYASDEGYVLDEMAELALYNRIGLIQRLDRPTYLTEVKEIVDKAIENAENAGLGGFFARLAARKRTDDGKLILLEKDFAQ